MYMYMYIARVEHGATCITRMLVLGNKVGGVRVGSLENLGELFIHPLNKDKDIPMDLVGLVRRLGEGERGGERRRERERERESESEGVSKSGRQKRESTYTCPHVATCTCM